MKINVEKIKKIMAKKGIDSTELAHIMGKKESWIYAILSGKYGRSFSTVENFAEALKVEDKDLIV